MAMKHGPCLLSLKTRIQAFETKRLGKLLRIFYLEHKTNDWVQKKINLLVGSQEPLLATVKTRKLGWFGHMMPRQPLQNHPSEHLGVLATPGSAEEKLEKQHQRVDIPALARTAHNGLLRKRRLKSLSAE